MKKINYLSQKQDTSCFPIALINCGKFCGVDLDLDYYIKLCKCETGSTIGAQEAINKSKLPLEKTDDYNLICYNGGIITIMHPFVNLHSVFLYPDKDEKIVFVNSWLACNEYKSTGNKFKKYLATGQNRRMWYIKKLKN